MLKNKKIWLSLAGILILGWAGLTAYRMFEVKQQEEAYGILKEGDVLPASMPLRSQDGKFTNFGDYAGRVVLINFWAGWCGPCLQEMPGLYSLQKSLEGPDFTIIGVSMDDDMAQGLATLDRLLGKAPFPQFKGVEQAIAARFPIEGLPFTVVVDKKGVIRYAQAGERNWNAEDAVKFIKGLM